MCSRARPSTTRPMRSDEHTSELQSLLPTAFPTRRHSQVDRRPREEDADSGDTDGDMEDDDERRADDEEDEVGDVGKPLSDALVRDLTAHRTLALRLVLGQQPAVALIALTHVLASQTFYHAAHEIGRAHV